MFDHVTLGVADVEASARFYDAALGALYHERTEREGQLSWGGLTIAGDREPTGNAHVAMLASTEEVVDAFHAAALEAGGRDNGAPGPRPYGPRYYAAYALDPDGTNIEAVFRPMAEWLIDHVVVGVADLETSRRFYGTVLAPLGRNPLTDYPDATAYGQHDGALWIVQRTPTTGLHLGIAAVGRDAVDAFWQAGIDAGFTSTGDPGERPELGEGVYAASLRDPDGNDVEAVCRTR